MKYAIINAEGVATAFYDNTIHASIPAEAVAITQEQWREYLADQGMKRFVNGEVVTRTKTAEELRAEQVTALQVELAALEIATARAMIWLIKKLVAKNVLTLADIPQQLRDYQARIDEINEDLAGG